MTITEFLEARIAEDEAIARDRPNSAQIHYSGCYYYNYSLDAGWECDCDEDGAGTRRLLAECAAKRAIINNSADAQPGYMDDPHWNGFNDCHESALYSLAAVYASHPAYDPRWAA